MSGIQQDLPKLMGLLCLLVAEYLCKSSSHILEAVAESFLFFFLVFSTMILSVHCFKNKQSDIHFLRVSAPGLFVNYPVGEGWEW